MTEEIDRTPNWPFLIGLGFNIWIGCWQTGLVSAGNNVVGDYLQLQLNWTDDEAELNNSIIAFCTIIGLTVGLFSGNVFVAYGRRITIIMFYLILLVSTGITLIQNFWAIAIGKFVMAFSAGNILIATNLILNETIPRQLNSLFGNLVNFGIITGIFMELALGLAFPDLDSEAAKTTQIWRIAYGF